MSQIQTTKTVLDRYIALMDRAIHDSELLGELPSVFAPDATVQLEELEPVVGLPAIAEFYRGFYSAVADLRHFWNTTLLEDGRLKADFVVSGRTADGHLMARRGIEYATVDSDGLITHLRATSTEAPPVA
ncbi:nuclear transport factor 2 family protein [Streptomyces justiciae]|uniref:nuclear transport factor 2 family protein n=1 Tax=Streptomyces justiciae TaxID=2780140 RepID=UPI0021187663|nr:nuclear transport factor 2 family protein [Streptomyces justiciae]MCW8378661.1 nuclear transport factor 2 family protein [Streptomyces justiciae]